MGIFIFYISFFFFAPVFLYGRVFILPFHGFNYNFYRAIDKKKTNVNPLNVVKKFVCFQSKDTKHLTEDVFTRFVLIYITNVYF